MANLGLCASISAIRSFTVFAELVFSLEFDLVAFGRGVARKAKRLPQSPPAMCARVEMFWLAPELIISRPI